jgi:predicted acylesterase/phospholipase RssA
LINHSGKSDIPKETKRIKLIRNNIKTLHLKKISETNIKRIIRFITNNTIGLVLGGGGAKGFAHLGLYKAMNELEIPIDVVGGTSAGSIIAAQIALGLNLDEIIRLNKSVNKLKMFKEYGFPYISLIKSKKIEKAAKLVGKNRNIEDMWIPFFAPATDLTNSKIKLFESGPVWEAIRSSGALPGIVMPHFKNKSALVDGGVLNNLPVDIMREKFSGNIISASCSKDDSSFTNLNSIPNQFSLFLEKLFKRGSFNKKYNYVPTIPELILKMSVVSSSRLTEENIKLSNLYLELPVENYGLTDFKDAAMLNMIDIGYNYSLEKLREYKKNLLI